ncbi:3-oxoacyl-[acyl-carrier protein] reductase [Paraburkholderia sp. GAS41]|jgi:3-oxoacyl-[acyl-carrier protein] reductase|uniref:SDR family NAD(P)-dependent oxidoreductase n=1 Tax=Paraburkholderia sp. GAS41 TaxID=3035134 RepID=UPI003D1A9AC7
MPVALITGASRGIGAAIAMKLAGQGYRVVVNHRDSAQQADEVVAAIVAAGGQAIATQTDVTRADDVANMVNEVNQRWGGIDVLMHTALTPYVITSFAELTWEQLGGKLDTEMHAAFLVTKAVVPGMIARGYGRLIYMSALPSRRAREGMITLGTSKAALDQFVKYVALELAPHGITANLVAPTTVEGGTATRLIPPERLQAIAAGIPMKRLARSSDVADTVAFLASEGSGFTSGHYIPVSGGLE